MARSRRAAVGTTAQATDLPATALAPTPQVAPPAPQASASPAARQAPQEAVIEAAKSAFAFSPVELEAKRAMLAQAKAVAEQLAVVDAASLDEANEWVRAIVTEKDAIEAMRKSATGPLNAALRTVNGWFRPLVDFCEAAERTLKNSIGLYVSAQRRLQAQSYQQAVVAHVQGQHDTAAAALSVASTAQTAPPAGTAVREVWEAEIINENLLTREWLTPDVAKIQAHARGTPISQDPYPIPGVRFVRKAIVSVRR